MCVCEMIWTGEQSKAVHKILETPAGGGQPKIRSGSAANAIRCAATSAVRM